jgi:hypothetical protein
MPFGLVQFAVRNESHPTLEVELEALNQIELVPSLHFITQTQKETIQSQTHVL